MRLDAKLKAIIYNVQPRDDWSQGVMEPAPEGKAGCEYVVGGPDQEDWFYCGHPKQDRSVYCEHHHSLCYTHRRRKATA